MTLDAIGLEVMAHAFAAVPEEMGALLVESALSPNVRERRDSSAALFDADGEMLAEAAHIPVHLGAMPEAVAAIRELAPVAGESFILNDPFTGGTHLPDITMVHAIDLDGDVVGFTVVRAHHSDVGGSRAGSMPPHSSEIFHEGIIIPPVRWSSGSRVFPDVERLVLANTRTPAMRRGDLNAQWAACLRGADRYRELVARYGVEHIEAAGRDLQAYAERRARAAIDAQLRTGVFEACDVMEGDGIVSDDQSICVRVEAKNGELHADFTGSSPAAQGNINCPLSVTRSAVLFVVRCMIPGDIPANGGVQRVVHVTAPAGCLVNAEWPHAVVAGNVETSQRIADTLFKALADETGLPAQGQGTMNNTVFGGRGWTYYETLGGGQGASATAPGVTAVHVGMSNTRNTPVEVFEMEHPLRVVEYRVREGSGGSGRHRGGDGVVREFQALDEIEVSLISERRRRAPQGAAGGSPGAVGVNSLNGKVIGGRAAVTLKPGDRLRIETPGGGGWGTAQ